MAHISLHSFCKALWVVSTDAPGNLKAGFALRTSQHCSLSGSGHPSRAGLGISLSRSWVSPTSQRWDRKAQRGYNWVFPFLQVCKSSGQTISFEGRHVKKTGMLQLTAVTLPLAGPHSHPHVQLVSLCTFFCLSLPTGFLCLLINAAPPQLQLIDGH